MTRAIRPGMTGALVALAIGCGPAAPPPDSGAGQTGATRPAVVQAATDVCPRFETTSPGPVYPTRRAFPGVGAIALGPRDVVYREGNRLRAVAINGRSEPRTIYEGQENLGASIVVDDASAFVADDRGLLRIPLTGGPPATLAISGAPGAAYEPVLAGPRYVYVVATRGCTTPQDCAKADRLLRVPRGGGKSEALRGAPPDASPLLATGDGLVFTTTEKGPDGKAIVVLWRWKDGDSAATISRVVLKFNFAQGESFVAGAQAEGDTIFLATTFGDIFGIPASGGAARFLKGSAGGVTAFAMNRRFFFTSHQVGGPRYTLQIPRDGVVDRRASDSAQMSILAGDSLRANGACACATAIVFGDPHSSAHHGTLECALVPFRE